MPLNKCNVSSEIEIQTCNIFLLQNEIIINIVYFIFNLNAKYILDAFSTYLIFKLKRIQNFKPI